MTITHENFVFLRELDGFIPEIYNIRIETCDGVYLVKGHTCNARVFGTPKKGPDMPAMTLVLDDLKGKFIYNDGKVVKGIMEWVLFQLDSGINIQIYYQKNSIWMMKLKIVVIDLIHFNLKTTIS